MSRQTAVALWLGLTAFIAFCYGYDHMNAHERRVFWNAATWGACETYDTKSGALR